MTRGIFHSMRNTMATETIFRNHTPVPFKKIDDKLARASRNAMIVRDLDINIFINPYCVLGLQVSPVCIMPLLICRVVDT